MAPEILIFDAPVDLSNVMLVCPKCGELTRVGYQRLDDQPKRLCRKCETVMDA
jgi:large subunit ribosomal protein L24